MRNLKIVVEYDGTAYHGWQRQTGVTTVQQVLEDSIARITSEKITVIGSGRTDAGVHALNQSAHFITYTAIETRNLLLGINSLLPSDLVIKEIREMGELFHARYDVKSKTYMYQIVNTPVRPVLQRSYSWHVRAPLDMKSMAEGLSFLKGRHDFSSFCGKLEGGANCVRTVKEARIEKTGSDLLRTSLEADGFLQYMVRTIVGTLVEVGRGKRRPDELLPILRARERKYAGLTAPPQGLFLMEVKY